MLICCITPAAGTAWSEDCASQLETQLQNDGIDDYLQAAISISIVAGYRPELGEQCREGLRDLSRELPQLRPLEMLFQDSEKELAPIEDWLEILEVDIPRPEQ